MKIQLSLYKNDFLEYQLYTDSKNKRISKKKRNTWLMLTSSFLLFAVITFYYHDKQHSYLLFIITIITFLFFPFYQRKQYKTHYSKHIEENYYNRFGQESTLNFEEEYITSNDANFETKMNYTAFEELNEIKDYYFIKLKTGGSLIIPKNKLTNSEEFHLEINKIADKFNWKKNVELDWKWK
ncbi:MULTISPECIES: YcxB family protein [Flavobacterium]|uniref:YcxB family protein n=1 Tax=Flavobacterium jumunjinense TaxID=998845 RepID=A0ABV5GRM7_9FLAO|nr:MULTISPECIES: YcxB family protein [Flavobacterium]